MMAEPRSENEREIIDELDGAVEKSENASVKMEKSRREKRKERKKMKRKQLRREAAETEKKALEAWLNDPAEQEKVEREAAEEMAERERALKEFEERERAWIEFMEKKKKAEEEQEEEENQRKILQEVSGKQEDGESDCDKDDSEYVEEGPAEIIWQGNEIIVRKKKVKVPKKETSQMLKEEDADRPTSNPLPPQSEVFADYLNASSAQQLLENVAKEVPNFGTEQDKAHCPFHLKTGACRFGQRCSRVHFYPDKSCTLLVRSMYNGPGLALDQDEGLEYTDEEIECCYEEFYEDVHTEFLKFGEIVNFKVCRNGSFHLRGNVYVHYKTLESALCAYLAVNGRYFAGKQIQCEFVNVTRWKVAICGEFMKSRLKTCSRGNACNFIHCFRNPGGDYEWADWDKPPPRYWVKRMAALFGYSDESAFWNTRESDHLEQSRSSSMMTVSNSSSRHHSRRSRLRETYNVVSRSCRISDDEDDLQDTGYEKRHKNHKRRRRKNSDERSVESEKARHCHHRTRSYSNDGVLATDMEEGNDSDLVGLRHVKKKLKSKHQNEFSDGELERIVGEDDFIMDSEYGDLHSQIHNAQTRKRSKDRTIDEEEGKRMHEAKGQLDEESHKEMHHCHSSWRSVRSPTDGHGKKRAPDGAFIEKQPHEDVGIGRDHSHRWKKSSKQLEKDEEYFVDHEEADDRYGNHSDNSLERNRSDQCHRREPSRRINKVSKLSDDLEHQENKLKEKPNSKRYRSSELDYQHDNRENSSSLDRWEPAAMEEVLEDDVDGVDRWKPESPEQEEKTITKEGTRYKSDYSDQDYRKHRSRSQHSRKRRSRLKENEADLSRCKDYEENHKMDHHVRVGTHRHRSKNKN